MKELACIIDDDPIFSFVAKKMIENHSPSINILSFANGQEALEGLNARTQNGEKLPEVIFLDLNMPVMDGWEFLESYNGLSEISPISIFIVSSSIDPADIEKAKNYAVVKDFISKPLTEESLNHICENC